MMNTERANWLKEIEIAQVMTTNKMSGVYTCPELRSSNIRIGQDDHANYPSRRGNTLHYRNGLKEKITITE